MTADKQNSNQQLFNPLVNASNITSTLLKDLFDTQNAFFQQGLSQFSDHSQKLMAVTDIPSAIEMTQQHVGQYQTQASQLSTAITADLTKATQAYQSMLTTQFTPEAGTATPAQTTAQPAKVQPETVAKKTVSSTTTTKTSPPVKKTAVQTTAKAIAKTTALATVKSTVKSTTKPTVKTAVKTPAKVTSKPAAVKKPIIEQKPLNIKQQPAVKEALSKGTTDV